MPLFGKFAFAALSAVCLTGNATAAGEAWQAAANTHSQIVKNCPAREHVEGALSTASSLMEQAKYQDAAATLQPLASLGCDARVSLLLAAAFEASGDVPKTKETLQKAHTAWPANTGIAASLAREYLSAGQVKEAVAALNRFHATPATPQQELELATLVFLAGHQLTSAQSVAEVSYKMHPSVHSLLLLANALQLQGRFKDVIRLLGEKRQTYAQSADFLITLAESEYDAVLYDTARADLEQAIELDQNSYQAHFLLGNVWIKSNDVDKAIAEYHKAITLAPNHPRTYYQLALALQTQHQEAEAESMLHQALAIDNHYAPAHVELGRMLLTQNHLTGAVEQLNLAVQNNPSSEQAYYLLAKAYAQLGEKDKSDAMAKRLIEVRNANWQSSTNKKGNESGANPASTP
jgi:protein O-GlcNAc transferase